MQHVQGSWRLSLYRACLDVKRSALHRERCFPERFSQGRMRVAGRSRFIAKVDLLHGFVAAWVKIRRRQTQDLARPS